MNSPRCRQKRGEALDGGVDRGEGADGAVAAALADVLGGEVDLVHDVFGIALHGLDDLGDGDLVVTHVGLLC